MAKSYKEILEIEVLNEVKAGLIARQFWKTERNPSPENKQLLEKIERFDEIDLFEKNESELKTIKEKWIEFRDLINENN